MAHGPTVQPREIGQFNRVDAALSKFAFAHEGLGPPERSSHLHLREAGPKAGLSKTHEHHAIWRAVNWSRAAVWCSGHARRLQPIPEYPSLDYSGNRGTLTVVGAPAWPKQPLAGATSDAKHEHPRSPPAKPTMNAYEKTVSELATELTEKVTRRAIRSLQRLEYDGGEEGYFETMWEDFCSQVQEEHSVAWGLYESEMERAVWWAADGLKPYELRAIWLQTQSGIDWSCREEGEDGDAPYLRDDVMAYVADHVIGVAGDWTNQRLRAFIDRPRD